MPVAPADRAILFAPLSLDEIVTGGEVRVRTGGAGFFAAWALARRGVRVTLHTPLAPEDQGLLDTLPPGAEIIAHPSRRTTRFRIEVDPARPNERVLRVLAASDPLDPDRIGAIEGASILFLGPLLPGDLAPAWLDRLRSAPTPCDLGAQGVVRRVDRGGRVRIARPDDAPDLPALRALAGDETEWKALPPALAARAPERITTRGDRGATIRLADPEVAIEIPAVPLSAPPREAIGLGDTFLAVYALERSRGSDPRTAGTRAASAAAALLEEGAPRRSQ
jgi:sugar/nucleoside kinase (ribokinase family)